MSVQREELLRLVEELPENEVPVVLDDVRRHLRAVREGGWPPAWFGAGRGRTSDVAARSEELLEDGFGRSSWSSATRALWSPRRYPMRPIIKPAWACAAPCMRRDGKCGIQRPW